MECIDLPETHLHYTPVALAFFLSVRTHMARLKTEQTGGGEPFRRCFPG